LKVLNKKIYQVGGSIRDKLLDIQSSDIDLVAVGYTEDDFSHLIKIGKDFPVFLNEQNQEIALAREDKKIANGYNGFSTNTTNVTIEDDLKRRDLTINSIAYDIENDKYIDPFNGISDINNKILRHTSDSFTEDPLRVLRIARFQAKFPNFTIDTKTKQFIYLMRNELQSLEPNRVYKELKKVLLLENSHLFFITLKELKVLDVVFPNIAILSNEQFSKSMRNLKLLEKESFLLKLLAIYSYIEIDINHISLPKKIQKSLKTLKTSQTNIIHFIKNFRKDDELFKQFIIYENIIFNNTARTEELANIHKKISKYSPKLWIEQQIIKPSPSEIKAHINSTISRYDLSR
jgi:tRNA nucleotidyltransferase (CCA-adding enzyme)